MAKGGWRLTVRHGSQVRKLRVETLDEALAAALEQVDAVRREGGLPAISGLRDFEPGQRVHARVEISGRGLRPATGGFDVMGDGSVVAYTGGVRREALAADSLGEAADRLGAALGG